MFCCVIYPVFFLSSLLLLLLLPAHPLSTFSSRSPSFLDSSLLPRSSFPSLPDSQAATCLPVLSPGTDVLQQQEQQGGRLPSLITLFALLAFSCSTSTSLFC